MSACRVPKRHSRAAQAQFAAMDRLIRAAERRTGTKVTRAEVDAVLAELDATHVKVWCSR